MSDDGANVIKPEPTIQQVQAAIQTTASIKSKVSSTRVSSQSQYPVVFM